MLMKFKGQIIRQITAWLNTVINHIQMKENKIYKVGKKSLKTMTHTKKK